MIRELLPKKGKLHVLKKIAITAAVWTTAVGVVAGVGYGAAAILDMAVDTANRAVDGVAVDAGKVVNGEKTRLTRANFPIDGVLEVSCVMLDGKALKCRVVEAPAEA